MVASIRTSVLVPVRHENLPEHEKTAWREAEEIARQIALSERVATDGDEVVKSEVRLLAMEGMFGLRQPKGIYPVELLASLRQRLTEPDAYKARTERVAMSVRSFASGVGRR